nr:MAG TPA: hypothetical protein [Caudoviricetes sp.]
MEKFYSFLLVLSVIILVGIFGIIVIATVDDCVSIEVECYSIGMEITHAEESTYSTKYHGIRTTRTFYLRGDDKAMAIEVGEETFARFTCGDWVEVEVKVMESAVCHTIKEKARIIGAMEN